MGAVPPPLRLSSNYLDSLLLAFLKKPELRRCTLNNAALTDFHTYNLLSEMLFRNNAMIVLNSNAY